MVYNKGFVGPNSRVWYICSAYLFGPLKCEDEKPTLATNERPEKLSGVSALSVRVVALNDRNAIWHLAFGIGHLAFGIWHLASGIPIHNGSGLGTSIPSHDNRPSHSPSHSCSRCRYAFPIAFAITSYSQSELHVPSPSIHGSRLQTHVILAFANSPRAQQTPVQDAKI